MNNRKDLLSNTEGSLVQYEGPGICSTLMAESEEELKSLLMKVKVESEKVGLKVKPASS